MILKAEHGHVHQRVDYDDLQKTVMPQEWQQNSQKYTVIATFIEMELFDIFSDNEVEGSPDFSHSPNSPPATPSCLLAWKAYRKRKAN